MTQTTTDHTNNKTRVQYMATLPAVGDAAGTFLCPGCAAPVMAMFSIEGTMKVNLTGSGSSSSMDDGKVIGMRISHDCMPKATRSA